MTAEMGENTAAVNIDDDVEWLTEQITALKELGLHDDVDEGQKYDVSIRWGAALAGRLPRLVHYSSRGLLDEADESRFQTLCDELRELSDVINRVGLARPVFSDAAAEANGRREPRPATSRRGLGFRRR
ncbi:hypothetical protein [Mycobacterium sp.]|uniref:hypothetical protein n=1 Tax=Mycobacterium sp. TaxID=1785 RepID=UPI003D0B924A